MYQLYEPTWISRESERRFPELQLHSPLKQDICAFQLRSTHHLPRSQSLIMKIALAQICSTDDVQHNIRVSEQVAKRAAAANAEIVFFPECADIVFSPDYDVKRERKELKDTARYVGEMKRIAKETGLWLHFGCHLPVSVRAARNPGAMLTLHLLTVDRGQGKMVQLGLDNRPERYHRPPL